MRKKLLTFVEKIWLDLKDQNMLFLENYQKLLQARFRNLNFEISQKQPRDQRTSAQIGTGHCVDTRIDLSCGKAAEKAHMTALKGYERLECTGLWRSGPAIQRREVVVSCGQATLILTDMQNRPLAHWSLAAVDVQTH